MEWTLIISLSLNILSVLVYFNIPEFLQDIFIKKIEYKYDIKLDKKSKHNEILPELFYTVSEAVAYYDMNYSGDSLNQYDLMKYAKLKNFITKNQFFMPEHIKDLAREIEHKTLDCMTAKREKAEDLATHEEELKRLQKN